MNKYLGSVLILLLVSACVSSPTSYRQTPQASPDRVSIAEARATSAYAEAAVTVANAEATLTSANADLQATAQASQHVEATRSAVQATLDANAIAEAQAKSDAAKVQYDIAVADAKLKTLEIISNTHAVTTAIQLREIEYQKEAATSSNPFYGLVDWVFYVIPRVMLAVILPGILFVILWRVGRTITRWFEKRFEINGVTYILTADGPTPLLLPAGDSSHNSELETGNTETLGNTGNTGGNTDGNTGNTDSASVSNPEETDLLPTYNLGHPANVLRMTPAERAELLATRHEAIGLLAKCSDYYKAHPPDTGIIPRYTEIGMNAEVRGLIVDNLVYSGCASVIKNKRTFVVPEIGTCAALLRLIVSNQRRVYPVGYNERRQERLDKAVMALPEGR